MLPVLGAVVLLAFIAYAFIAYYRWVVCVVPRVLMAPTAHNQRLVRAMPLLASPFCPTPYLINAHAQTIWNVVLRHKVQLGYERELLSTPDGGTLALDWAVPGGRPDAQRPTCILLTGFTGSSEELEIRILARDLVRDGYAVCVMHFRGNGGAPLTTTRFSDSPECDTVTVVDHVCSLLRACSNRAPLLALGVSAGANVLALHAAHTGAQCRLDAFCGISNPWDIHETLAVRLKQGLVAPNVYDPFFVPKRLAIVRRHLPMFEKLPGFDLQRVASSPGACEFDAAIVVPATQEFDSVESFYRARSSCHVLERIATPCLFINALDDPFTNCDKMRPAALVANEHIIAVVTQRGGHLGFVDGWRGGVGTKTWDERLVQQYFDVIRAECRVPRRLK